MFRNQYDTDVTVWSPEGRLLQVSSKEEEELSTTLELYRNPFAAGLGRAFRFDFSVTTSSWI